MKYLTCVIAAFALMFAFSQDANAQIFRGRCGGSYTYSYPSYSYSYPTYSYPSYSSGYYFRGCDGNLYYVYPSQSQPVYVNPTPKKEGPSFQDLPEPKKVPLTEPKTAPKKEAPGFQDLPAPKTVEQPKTTVQPKIIIVPAPGFQDLPPKK